MNRMYSVIASTSCVVVTLSMGAPAGADLIDFDSLQVGEIVAEQFAGMGVHIEVINDGHPSIDLGIIFDSFGSSGHDSDLEGPPWSSGNASSDVFANLLIIAENDVDANNDGLIDDPDDEAGGGSIIFRFDIPVFEFGFSLIDIETSESGPTASVMFFNDEVFVGMVDFSDLVDSGSAFFDPTIVFGNHSANHVQPMSFFNGIDPLEFNEVRFVLQGSGAIDNIFFASVPSPGATALVLLGLIIGGGGRRRRHVAQTNPY